MSDLVTSYFPQNEKTDAYAEIVEIKDKIRRTEHKLHLLNKELYRIEKYYKELNNE